MAEGKQNLAIGTILGFERTLPESDSSFRTILLLHRTPDIEVQS